MLDHEGLYSAERIPHFAELRLQHCVVPGDVLLGQRPLLDAREPPALVDALVEVRDLAEVELGVDVCP